MICAKCKELIKGDRSEAIWKNNESYHYLCWLKDFYLITERGNIKNASW